MLFEMFRMVLDAVYGGDPTFDPIHPETYALARYFALVVGDGDWLNDWRTHLPVAVRGLVTFFGWIVASVLGS
jgi:hypothetical protein